MPSRFTLKDLVVLLLLLGIAVSVWWGMIQRDRHWDRLVSIDERLVGLERNIARVEKRVDGVVRKLEDGATGTALRAAGARAMEGGTAVNSAESNHTSPASPSWARPGVPIAWQNPWGFASNPTAQEGFEEGGEFTEIFEGQPANVGPYTLRDVYGRRVVDRVAETLATNDPVTLELRGVLADAWQIDMAKFLRVHLNPRARFSDGTPVTAEDVRWTFMEFVRNPEIEAERIRSITDTIERVDVIDEQTAEFIFKEAVFTNLSYTLGLYVLPKHFYEKFDARQINTSTGLLLGSGMYKFASIDPDNQWKPGTDLVLVRNEQYWGSARPPLDRLRYRVEKEHATRLIAYRKGDGDMITPTGVMLRHVPEEPGWKQENQAVEWINMRSGYSIIVWQCGERDGRLLPFHDKRVRQAMTLAIDRERIVRDIYEGVGKVATGPANSESHVLDRTIKPWPYDPERAKALLAEAGWRDRDGSGVLRDEEGYAFEFELTRPAAGEIEERYSNYLRDQYARIGIRMTERVVDWSIQMEISKNHDFDAIAMGWSPTSPESDPKQQLHSTSAIPNGDNNGEWRNAEADRLIDLGRREVDEAKRHKIWHQLHALLHEEQPYTFVREVPWYRFIRRNIGNVQLYKSGLETWEFFRASSPLPVPMAP